MEYKKRLEEARNPRNNLLDVYNIQSLGPDRQAAYKARKLLMVDLITEGIAKNSQYMNTVSGKYDVLREFVKVAGVTMRSAQNHWNECAGHIFTYIQPALILADVLRDSYELRDDMKLNAQATEIGTKDKTDALKAVGEVNKNLGDLAAKALQYEVNADRNQVLREKTKSEFALGAADLNLRFKGTLEEKKSQIYDLLLKKDTVRDVQIKLLGEDDEANEIDVTKYKGIEIEDDAD